MREIGEVIEIWDPAYRERGLPMAPGIAERGITEQKEGLEIGGSNFSPSQASPHDWERILPKKAE